MKYFFILTLTLSICCGSVFSQNAPPPPPAPLIYKAPDKSELKEFTSEDKSFQITFAGTPKISEQQFANGSSANYQIYRQGSYSIVIVNKSDSNLEGRKDQIYEVVKANLLKAPKSKIESEKEITENGVSGKEFSVLQDYTFGEQEFSLLEKRVI